MIGDLNTNEWRHSYVIDFFAVVLNLSSNAKKKGKGKKEPFGACQSAFKVLLYVNSL